VQALALAQQLVLVLVQEPALLFYRMRRGKRLQPGLPKRASCSFESPLMEKTQGKNNSYQSATGAGCTNTAQLTSKL